MDDNISISDETRKRIERLAKMSRRSAAHVIDAAVGIWEQSILTHMPPEKRSAYMAGVLAYDLVSNAAPAEKIAPRERDAYEELKDPYGRKDPGE
jgi:hypothetical protein